MTSPAPPGAHAEAVEAAARILDLAAWEGDPYWQMKRDASLVKARSIVAAFLRAWEPSSEAYDKWDRGVSPKGIAAQTAAELLALHGTEEGECDAWEPNDPDYGHDRDKYQAATRAVLEQVAAWLENYGPGCSRSFRRDFKLDP